MCSWPIRQAPEAISGAADMNGRMLTRTPVVGVRFRAVVRPGAPRCLAEILHPRRDPSARIRDALRRIKDVVDLLVSRAERAEKGTETLKIVGQK